MVVVVTRMATVMALARTLAAMVATIVLAWLCLVLALAL